MPARALVPVFRAVAFAALWLPAACENGPAEPIGPADAAVATRACGPADGPGVAVTLAATAEAARAPSRPYVSFFVWQEPGALAGRTWVLTGGRDGGAVRQPADGDYEVVQRGTATVRRVAADTTIEGTVDLEFPSGARVRQAFRAAWRPSPGLLCG